MNLNTSNIRSEIITLIEQINPIDLTEEKHVSEITDWVKSGAPIFRISKPDHPHKHLVSYFIVFDEKAKKILLVDHKKACLWLPSGGHVEIDEHPAETVRRECKEELGIDAIFWKNEPIFITKTTTVGHTAGHIDVSLWYVIKGSVNQQYEFDKEEFNAVKWFGFNEISFEKSDPQNQTHI